jgi:hypothetical protein
LTKKPAVHATLFISHAKMDGLPLAQALNYQIKSIGWLCSFYDADDLPAVEIADRLIKTRAG